METVHKRKREEENSVLILLEIALELLVFLLVYYYTWKEYYREVSAFPYYGWGKIILIFIYAIIVFVMIRLNDGFLFGYRKSAEIVISQWVSLFVADLLTYLQLCLMANKLLHPSGMLIIFFLDIIVSATFTVIYSAIYRHQFVPLRMLLISGKADGEAERIKEKIMSQGKRYSVEEVISPDIPMSDLQKKLFSYDGIIITDVSAEKRNDILKFAYAHEIRTYVSPKISDILVNGAETVNLFDTPLRLIKGLGISLGERFIKRMLDIILSFITLIILSPLFLIIAISIKICDSGPVLFKQNRVTKDGRIFALLKFRSMVVDAEKIDGARLASQNDLRVTRVGRFLRRTRMDELPQLINIIRGEMSIVGPRPERPELYEKYCDDIPEFSLRLKVKGGLTGYAQVYGRYNTGAIDKLKYDLMYIGNYSLGLDFKVMLLTIGVLFKKEATEGVFEKDNGVK